ncbi:MAG: hypothetical protein IJ244_01310 [Bacteroidaceae bacterium]|nr:hypothetical protein [Bacteroidaceae bacterium]
MKKEKLKNPPIVEDVVSAEELKKIADGLNDSGSGSDGDDGSGINSMENILTDVGASRQCGPLIFGASGTVGWEAGCELHEDGVVYLSSGRAGCDMMVNAPDVDERDDEGTGFVYQVVAPIHIWGIGGFPVPVEPNASGMFEIHLVFSDEIQYTQKYYDCGELQETDNSMIHTCRVSVCIDLQFSCTIATMGIFVNCEYHNITLGADFLY